VWGVHDLLVLHGDGESDHPSVALRDNRLPLVNASLLDVLEDDLPAVARVSVDPAPVQLAEADTRGPVELRSLRDYLGRFLRGALPLGDPSGFLGDAQGAPGVEARTLGVALSGEGLVHAGCGVEGIVDEGETGQVHLDPCGSVFLGAEADYSARLLEPPTERRFPLVEPHVAVFHRIRLFEGAPDCHGGGQKDLVRLDNKKRFIQYIFLVGGPGSVQTRLCAI